MARQRQIVGGLDKVAQGFKGVVEALEDIGLREADFLAVLEKRKKRDQLARAISQIEGLFSLEVDFSLSIFQIFEGTYNQLDGRIDSGAFPPEPGKRLQRVLSLVDFKQPPTWPDVEKEFSQRDLTHATLWDIHAFKKAHPELAKTRNLVACGSPVREAENWGHSFVPYIGEGWALLLVDALYFSKAFSSRKSGFACTLVGVRK